MCQEKAVKMGQQRVEEDGLGARAKVKFFSGLQVAIPMAGNPLFCSGFSLDWALGKAAEVITREVPEHLQHRLPGSSARG
jgi:hypothetical protein